MTTAIEWTDETWNPVRGCSRVSAGCENCYAERTAWRHHGKGRPYEGLVKLVNGHPVWTGKIRTVHEALEDPLIWRKQRRVFVNSMSDLFHEGVPDEFIDRVFAVMALATRHTFQILTKRPQRMLDYMEKLSTGPADRIASEAWAMGMNEETSCAAANIINGYAWPGGPPPDGRPLDGSCPYWPMQHVWLGVSVEDQEAANERIPLLLDTPAAVRWVSYEPALEAVDLSPWLGSYCFQCQRFGEPPDTCRACGELTDGNPGLDWVVTGGESGPGARPFDVRWGVEVVHQCRQAGVPVFVKQIGATPDGWCRNRLLDPGEEYDHGFCDAWEASEARHCGARCHFLRDRKGGRMDEWPPELRVREWPR